MDGYTLVTVTQNSGDATGAVRAYNVDDTQKVTLTDWWEMDGYPDGSWSVTLAGEDMLNKMYDAPAPGEKFACGFAAGDAAFDQAMMDMKLCACPDSQFWCTHSGAC